VNFTTLENDTVFATAVMPR